MYEPGTEDVEGLAEVLVEHGMDVSAGDTVRIESGRPGWPLAYAVAEKVYERGGDVRPPHVVPLDEQFDRIRYENSDEAFLEEVYPSQLKEMEELDAHLHIMADENPNELSGVPQRKQQTWRSALEDSGVRSELLNNTNWTIAAYPTRALAQQAGMSYEECCEYVFDASIRDWSEPPEKYYRVKDRIDAGSEVQILGEDTDLTFSIGERNGINNVAIIGWGPSNIPDGETFTAPKPDSVEGDVYFDLPTTHPRITGPVEGVRITFENGEAVDWTADKGEDILTDKLTADDGSSYIGEFGIGMNEAIDSPLRHILFDEKMNNTIHLAIGNAYPTNLQYVVETDHLNRDRVSEERFRKLMDETEEVLRLDGNEAYAEYLSALPNEERSVAAAYRDAWEERKEALSDEFERQLNESSVHLDFIKDMTNGEVLIDGEPLDAWE